MGGQVIVTEVKKACEAAHGAGMEQGMEQGIQAFVVDFVEEGYPRERIIDKLVRRFQLNKDDAEQYYDKFAKVTV